MKVLTRDEWGAREPRDPHTPISTPTSHLILHHFAADWPGPAGVRRCQNFHMDDRGYDDIAYSMVVDADRVYVGRGPGVQGAHTRGWNSRAHAVAAAIDGTSHVEDRVLDRLAEAAVWLWRHGAVDRPQYDGGHRDYGTSACPGTTLYSKLGEINRRAAVLAEGRTVTSGRIAGEDSWGTAAAMARTIFPHNRHQGGILWIVRGDKWTTDTIPAGQIPGPCLPVPPDGTLPDAIAAEIAAYRPDRVMAIGGTGAVSDSMLEQARKAAST